MLKTNVFRVFAGIALSVIFAAAPVSAEVPSVQLDSINQSIDFNAIPAASADLGDVQLETFDIGIGVADFSAFKPVKDNPVMDTLAEFIVYALPHYRDNVSPPLVAVDKRLS